MSEIKPGWYIADTAQGGRRVAGPFTTDGDADTARNAMEAYARRSDGLILEEQPPRPAWCSDHFLGRTTDGQIDLHFHQGEVGPYGSEWVRIEQSAKEQDAPIIVQDDQGWDFSNLEPAELREVARSLNIAAAIIEGSA